MTLAEIEARLRAIRQELETRSGELTPEQLDALEGEVNTLTTQRTAMLASAERRSALLSSIADGQPEGARVTRSFPTPGAEQRDADNDDRFGTMEYRRAFMNHVVRGAAIPAEYRADATTMTTDVGAVIPTTVLNTIIERMEAVGMILPLVTTTAYKGGVSIPQSTAKPTASWVAQGAGSDKQKKTAGTLTFAYHKLRCAVAVSFETDTMAIPAFESALITSIVTAMTKALEQAIITGSGTGQPKGILAETPAADQAIDSAAPSYADLVAAEAALPLEYEANAVWCMSKKTFMQYQGITDSTGQPIARVNYGIGGRPERVLLGRTVVLCNYVDSYTAALATGKVFAFLFDFQDYVLNTNYAMGLKKYEDNNTDDMVTKAIMLADGKVVDKGSLVVVKKKAGA